MGLNLGVGVGQMNETLEKEREKRAVHRSLVISVFADKAILIAGVVTTVLAMVLSGIYAESIAIYACAAVCLVVGTARAMLNYRFNRELDAERIKPGDFIHWERWFTAGAVLNVFIFGVWCVLASLSNNEFSRLVSVTVTFANLIGVCARSFPIERLVNMQLVAISVPLVLSLYMTGGAYHYLALLMVPYLFGLHRTAAIQRKTLLENINQRRTAESLAERFHTTLNNVPQGICMFDESGKLLVANEHIGRFLGRSSKSVERSTMGHLIDLMESQLCVDPTHTATMRKWLTTRSHVPLCITSQLGDAPQKTVRFRASTMQDGGTICTFEDISKEVRAADQIDWMTRFDRLTGLMNRDQLSISLKEEIDALNEDQDCAVVLINIDHFKQINDMQGHHFGDLLLCEVSDRIKRVCNGVGTCARFSGDEFAVVISDRNALDVATNIADLVISSLGASMNIEGRKLHIGCTIGIAITEQESLNTGEVLLKYADTALLWAKRDGRGEWRVFNSQMSDELNQQRALENDLRAAVTNNEFMAVYQPIVSVDRKAVATCEALMRWNHPRLGFVPPSKFIPIAEDLGLVVEMGNWMLEQACMDCAKWPGNTTVAVNLSPLQFKQGDLVQSVRDALTASQLEPHRLELEITESLMLHDMGSTVDKLNELKKMGVRISLDDFGTGFSSLSYMNNLPLDKVKIDRSFVVDIRPDSKSLTLVQAITTLGQKLGLSVVVEGVETVEELSVLLASARPNEIQGYLFSKPVNNEELTDLLVVENLAALKMLSPLYSALKAAA